MVDENNPLIEDDSEQFLDNMPKAGDERQSLADFNIVDALVRSFVIHVVNFRKAQIKNPKENRSASADAEAVGLKYTNIFLGKNADYYAPNYNKSGKVAEWVGSFYGISGPPDGILEAFFSKIYLDTANLLIEHEANKINDDVAKFRMDTMIEDAVCALMGIPNEAD